VRFPVTEFPPEVAQLLARGAEVAWRPLTGADGSVTGAVILGVAWPLGWDVPRFREVPVPDSQCVPRRHDRGPSVLPRPSPTVVPLAPNAP
jgi:hypothetical protein